MTFPHHQQYLSEVGQRISRFAATSETAYILEEFAHHLEEQTLTLIDQGVEADKAQVKSIRMLGSSEALARGIKHAFRGALWMINGSSLFAVSAIALAVPLRDLSSRGILIQALSVLFSIGAFVLAASACGLGAKMSMSRVVCTLAFAGGLILAGAFTPRATAFSSDPDVPTGKVLLKSPLLQETRYSAPDGRILALTPTNAQGVSTFRIERNSSHQILDPLPVHLVKFYPKAAGQSSTISKGRPGASHDSFLIWAWVISTALISGGAYLAALIGEKKRTADHKRQAPPAHPGIQAAID